MRRKDFIISMIAHLALALVIVIINPISAMFRDDPGIIVVKTLDLSGSPAAGSRPQQEPAGITPPPTGKIAKDEEIDDVPVLKSNPKKEVIPEKKKPEPKPKPKPKIEEKKIDPSDEVAEDVKEQSKSDQAAGESVKQDEKGGLDVSGGSVGNGLGNGTGTGNSNLPYSIGMVLNILERNWNNVVRSPEAVTCQVYFRIDRYGYLLEDPMIEKSSGIAAFDQSVILAVKRSRQYPAFPPDFNYPYVGLHVSFHKPAGK